jgi:hypothetical protein
MSFANRKRKAEDQGGRTTSRSEFIRQMFEGLHRIQVWAKLKELEFYIDRPTFTNLYPEQRQAVQAVLECKLAKGDFDFLHRDFLEKLTQLEHAVYPRYESVINFLRPDAPSRSTLTSLALQYLDAENVWCLGELRVPEHITHIRKLRDSIMEILRKPNLHYKEVREVSCEIEEFVYYLYPSQRETLYLHLLAISCKPHPAQVAWVQHHIMMPDVAIHILPLLEACHKPSHALKELAKAIGPISLQVTSAEPGSTAAKLRAEAAELSFAEMEFLTRLVQDAKEHARSYRMENYDGMII